MRFINENVLSIITEEITVFSGIKLWVRGQDGAKQYLSIKSCSVNMAEFCNEQQTIYGKLRIDEGDRLAALKISISYHPLLGNIRGENHLDTDAAFGIDIENIPCAERFTANYMRCSFWCGTKFFNNLNQLPEKTQALLADTGKEYIYFLTTCDSDFKTNLTPCEGGLTLFAYSHFPQSEGRVCSLIIGLDENPYLLPEKTAEYGLSVMNKSGKLKKERRFPEMFEYLGWCSWDAFHMDVSQKKLCEKAEEFKSKEIPVRWMLLDDMWAECHNNNRETMHSREMFCFEGDPERFPGGLKAAIGHLKEKYGLMVGIWYPVSGYWNGIDPDGPIAEKYMNILTVAMNGRLVPSPVFDKALQYFYLFNQFFSSCGADFVKVDFQSFIFEHYNRLMPIGKAAKNMHEALEAASGLFFDGRLLNCMGMSNENFWNRPQSVVNRISDDFEPENRKWFIQHLIQCSFNSYNQGSLYTGDWDMWWSDDAQAKKNAVLRAMSGGPVYISDELNRSVLNTILPIVYSDGRIIRLEQSALPTVDCLMSNPESNGKIFKVFNRAGRCGVLAAFNLDENENEVSGSISASDIDGLDSGSYWLFDYFAQTVSLLMSGESTELTLQNYDDFRLYHIIPLNGEVTPVGLLDKYMSTATFEMLSNRMCRVFEGGKFAIISESRPQIAVNGENAIAEKVSDRLYYIDLPCTDKSILLEWK